MPTTALIGTQKPVFVPICQKQKSTRQIVREEIQRQKKIDELEEKYKNGELSKLEYTLQKAALNMPIIEIDPNFNGGINCMA